MQRIKIQTLIDITCSSAKRPGQGDQLEVNQYRNYTTFLQAVGLRANITFEDSPNVEIKKLNGRKFGSEYDGQEHAIWTFEFTPDRDDVYSDEDDVLALLKEDLHNVPVIKKLKETINTDKSVFDLKSAKYRNTIVSLE
jgi:hypothetical protein